MEAREWGLRYPEPTTAVTPPVVPPADVPPSLLPMAGGDP